MATHARQVVGQDDLQTAGGILFDHRIGGVGMHLRAPFDRKHDQVAGFVQHRMHRRIAAHVDVVGDHAGFRFAPEAAGNRGGIVDEMGEIIAELMPNDAEKIMLALEEQPGACTATLAFLHAAISASRAGIPRCHLVSNSINGALLQELFSRDGIGTQIVTESAEKLRQATISDIGGILDLIRPLEQQGLLVRRSREQLEMEINQFTLIERDGLVIGCAPLYPFPDDNVGEFACLAVHPDYRDADRGSILLKAVIQQARQRKYSKLFALTTRSIHWFLEHGFELLTVEDLPAQKKQLYNYQRRSKILAITL